MTNQLVSEAEVEEALHWQATNVAAMADAQTDAAIVEQQRKVMLAVLMRDMEGSMASREMRALADPRYSEFLENEYRNAINLDAQLTLKNKVYDKKIDVYRTTSANQRRGGI